MSLGVIYAIFALVMGIVMIRLVSTDEATPGGVVGYFLLGVAFAPVILVYIAGFAFVTGLQFVATVGRQE